MLDIYTARLRGGCRLELGQGADGLWLKVCKGGIEYNRSELHPRLLIFLAQKEGIQDDTVCTRHGIPRIGSAIPWSSLVHQIQRLEVVVDDSEEEE